MISVKKMMATVMAASMVLAGCGGNESAAPDSSPEASKEAVKEVKSNERFKIEVLNPGSGLPADGTDVIKKELDQKLNIDISMQLYASTEDYKNQLNIRMASNNIPDLFVVDRLQLKQYAQQNLLLDLTPYKSKLKGVQDFIGEDSWKKGTWNGKLYGIAKALSLPQDSLWVRKDWLDKLNLKPPATLEEFRNVIQAFVKNDPDGNGKADTLGLTGKGTNLVALGSIFGSFGVGLPGDFYVKGGKVVNSLYDPMMKDALEYIRKMGEDGLIDSELPAINGVQHQQKAIKGQAGIAHITWPSIAKDQIVEQIKAVNPNAQWIQLKPPVGPGGQFEGVWDIGASGWMLAIPKSMEKNPEKLQRVFDLLNYIATKEGSRLVQYGIQGTHYNLEGDKVAPTSLLDKEGAYFYLYQFIGRPEQEYLEVKFPKQKEYIAFAKDLPRIQVLNGYIDAPEGYNPSDATRYIQEETLKFAFGKRPISEYDNFLQTLEKTMNYKIYLDTATKQLNDLGFGK